MDKYLYEESIRTHAKVGVSVRYLYIHTHTCVCVCVCVLSSLLRLTVYLTM